MSADISASWTASTCRRAAATSSGSTKDAAEPFAYAVSAQLLAIVFIMILASQFQSFLQPLA